MLTTEVITEMADLEALSRDWEALCERSGADEPTLSPLWLGAWWRVFGREGGRALRAMLFYEGARLVGFCPLVGRRVVYRPQIPFRRLELCASGEDEADEIVSEYIGAVAERGAEERVAESFVAALMGGALGPWDELSMPAMNGELALPMLLTMELRRAGVTTQMEVTGVSPYIRLPGSWDDYLSMLPSSRRYLVRRSLRDFESWAGGDWERRVVTNAAELAEGKRVLGALHEARWGAEGGTGVFASERFSAFHDEVMERLFARGALDLQWLCVRGEPVAALYNIVWNGKVHFYQSGRAPSLPRGIRAGIVAHAYAIRSSIERGLREYDFLGGASRYKLDLALSTRPLVQLRAARPSLSEAARRTAELAIDGARFLRDGMRRACARA